MLPKSENRLALAKTILQFGIVASVACNRCCSSSKVCIRMEGRSKCAECTRRGRPCVPVSLDSLNQVHEKLESQLEKVEVEHAAQLESLQQLNSKILRLRKTIRQNKARTLRKVDCVVAELGSDNDGMEDEAGPPNMQQFVDLMSPSFWDSILSPPQNIKAPARHS